MWFYLSLLSTSIGGMFSVVMKKVTEGNDARQITIIGLLYYHVISLIISMVGYPEILGNFSFEIMIDIMPLIIIQSIGFFCVINAIKHCSVFTNSIIMSLKIIVPVCLGVVVLGESFNIWLIIISAIMISITLMIRRIDKPAKKSQKSSLKGIILAYSSAILLGISSFLSKIYVGKYESPFIISYYFAIFIIIAVLLYCLVTKKWQDININNLKNKRYFILSSSIDSSSSIINRFSLINGPLSLVSLISSCSIIISVLGGKIFLKEDISRTKLGLCFVMAGCVFLIAILR